MASLSGLEIYQVVARENTGKAPLFSQQERDQWARETQQATDVWRGHLQRAGVYVEGGSVQANTVGSKLSEKISTKTFLVLMCALVLLIIAAAILVALLAV